MRTPYLRLRRAFLFCRSACLRYHSATYVYSCFISNVIYTEPLQLSQKGFIIPAVPPRLSARPTRAGFGRELRHISMSQTSPRPIMPGLVQAEMNSQGQKVRSSVELSAKNSEPEETGWLMKAYLQTTTTFTNLFPLWLTMFSVIALKNPESFAW